MIIRPVFIWTLLCWLPPVAIAAQSLCGAVDSFTRAAQELVSLEVLLAGQDFGIGDSAHLGKLIPVAQLAQRDSLSIHPSQNEFLIDNYYQSSDTLASAFGAQHQTVASITRRQFLFGIGFRLGGQMYLNDGQLDRQRSGLTFTFDRSSYLNQLRQYSDLDATQAALDRLSRSDPQLLLARKEEHFRRYLTLTQTQAYRDLYIEADQVADSLRGYAAKEFDERSRALIAFHDRCDSLDQYYRGVLIELQRAGGQLRRQGSERLDSLRRLVAIDPEAYLLTELRKSPRLTELQRLALLARRFAIGNVRLPTDGVGSIGLPIRGIDFAYERGGLGAEVQFGHRILSRRFTPRDGLAFHDLNRGARFARLGLSYRGERHDYTVAITDAVQRDTTPDLPRRNRVVSLTGRTELAEVLSLTTELSYARTAPRADAVVSTTGRPAVVAADDLSWQLGLQLSPGESLSTELAVFRTGADYQSFANPYLYTDYQGVEAEVVATRVAGFLDASFALAGGVGTTQQSRENFRWRAQGQIRAQMSAASSLHLIFSPNVYRYTVTGQEGLSESSIYQFFYHYATPAGGAAHLGITNLNQGLTWADTSTVTQNVVATGQASLPLGRVWSVRAQGQHTFGRVSGDSPLPPPFNYGFGVSYGGQRHRVNVGIDYGRFAAGQPAGWGGHIDYQANLTAWAVLRLNAYLRPIQTIDTSNGEATPPNNQLYSQQSWLANF